MTTASKANWHPPPLPTPRILHLPRRTRRKQPTKNVAVNNPVVRRPPEGKLERLFDQERRRRSRRVAEESDDEEEVELRESDGGGGIFEENKWRFQAEILRAECKYLRMEKEIVMKKLERERAFMETTLKSAVHTLISGKKKICEGKSVNEVLEEQIEELAKRMVELQTSLRPRHLELRNCGKFDKQASLLQKKLKNCGALDRKCVKEAQEMEETSLYMQDAEVGTPGDPASNHKCNEFPDVEILTRKMEGLSNGMLLKKMEEEYGSILAATANCAAASSASTSRRYDLFDLPSSSLWQSLQETKSGELKTCAGHCRAIVRRIVEQVHAETEQWSQMQEMLGQVKEEIEKLQASRDFWEDRALYSDQKVHSLQSLVEEWKQKALSHEMKANELQKQVRMLQVELETSRIGRGSEMKKREELLPVSWEATVPKEKEKRVLTCRGKENSAREDSTRRKDGVTNGTKTLHRRSSRPVSPSRLPLQDIGHLSPLVRQTSKRSVFPLPNTQHDLVGGSL